MGGFPSSVENGNDPPILCSIDSKDTKRPYSTKNRQNSITVMIEIPTMKIGYSNLRRRNIYLVFIIC